MPALTHPPRITHATDHLVRICVRLDSAGSVTIRGGGVQGVATVTAGSDFTGYVELGGLAPATVYSYEVLIGGVLVWGPVSFQTLPAEGQPGLFNLVCVFDVHEDWDNFGPARLILDRYKDLSVPMCAIRGGDTGAEVQAFAYTLDALRTVHRDAWLGDGLAGAQALFYQDLPTWVTWDDWDSYGNNSAGEWPFFQTRVGRENTRQVYGEQFGGSPFAHSLATYKAVRVADCLILLLDNRCFRIRTPGTVDPTDPTFLTLNWDYLADSPAWGAEQLQWIKDRLLEHQDAPFKFLVNGCTIVDNSHAGDAFFVRRDSIGIYHRKERNDLLQWLADHPTAARGCVFLTGDDHHPALRIPSEWREQEDLIATTTPAASWPARPYVRIPDVKFSPFGGAGTGGNPLDKPWWGSPHEIMCAEELGFVGAVEVDTSSPTPRALFRWLRIADGSEFYRFEMIGSSIYTTESRYRTNANGYVVKQGTTWTPASGAGGAYTPGPAPASPYTLASSPSSAYAPPASPVSPWLGLNRAGLNAGFESADFSGWTDALNVFINAGQAQEGSYACLMRAVNNLFGPDVPGQLRKSLDLYPAGQSFRLTVWVKHEDTSFGLAPFSVSLDRGDGVEQEIATMDAVAGSGWRKIEHDFASVGDLGGVLLYEAPTTVVPSTIVLYLDNLTVFHRTPWTPATPPVTPWS